MANFISLAFEKFVDLIHSNSIKSPEEPSFEHPQETIPDFAQENETNHNDNLAKKSMLIGIPDHKKNNNYLDAIDTASNDIIKHNQSANL